MPPASPSEAIRTRRLRFLAWQLPASFCASFLWPSLCTYSPRSLSPFLFSLLTFQPSVLFFSLAISVLASPHPDPHAPIIDLASGLLGSLLRGLLGGFRGSAWDPSFRRRALRTFALGAFVVVCAASGFLGLVGVCGGFARRDWWSLTGVGLRGVGVGLAYAGHYLYHRRWVLQFPIVQRPFFFSFKIELKSAALNTLKLLTPSYLCSTLLMVLLPSYMRPKHSVGNFLSDQMTFCLGAAVVIFWWELSHRVLQVMFTRRLIYAPPRGTAAAETNPTVTLLEALEQSSSRSLLEYLAYLDLCMISESNAELWRRAAFFEESGATYRRITAACLKPLEQLTSKIGNALEGCINEKYDSLSQQLTTITEKHVNAKLQDAFNDFQVCTWSAQAVASITARSHSEDRFGVAQLTGCNTANISTLLSCLLAVEACLGKKTSQQPANLLGPGSIRFSVISSGRKDGGGTVVSRKKNPALHSKAYAMADILRTSIYGIVSSFEADMRVSTKASTLQKNWIADKSLYGTKEMLTQKLLLFLEFMAC